MRRTVLAVAVFTALLSVALFALDRTAGTTTGEVQTTGYDFDVLPGPQPAYEGIGKSVSARRHFTSTDLTMSCGWHTDCGCDNPRARIERAAVVLARGDCSRRMPSSTC